MTTITGTLVSTPSATLLSQLADAIQANHLSDSGETYFTQAQVEAWLKDAIADYSKYFPRELSHTITTTANTRKYDLPALFISPLSVEYPTDSTDPEYLKRRSHTNGRFWQCSGYYDIIHRSDETTPSQIWISEEPAANQTITIEYLCHHDYNISAGDEITVPAHHHHVLTLYVKWQATDLLKAQEEENPTSNSSLLMSILGQNGQVSKRDYLYAIQNIERQQMPTTDGRITWRVAETTEIY